jgi:deoxyribodipyrimidine photolyase-related protein
MPTPICLVFPQQLFEQHPALAAVSTFWLLEDDLFFLQLPFHRKKLAFHRASMSYYAENLRSNGKDVHYFKHNEAQLSAIFEKLKQCASQVHVVDPTDYLLEKRIRRFAQQYGLELIWHANPSFLNSRSDNDLLLGKQTQRFFLADFYKKQRLRLGILLEPDGQPTGGRWSFDADNRKALPKGLCLPEFPNYRSEGSKNAELDIKAEFPQHPGDPDLSFYPVTHEEAKAALHFFIQNNLSLFGPYQDAFSTAAPYVFHSNLSTALNAGLLTPKQVIDEVLKHYQQGKVAIESAEGFLRQVIGWREFVRAVYERVGVQQRNTNAMQHQRKLDWQELGNLAFLEFTSQKIDQHAYAHHIERLMLLGNFFFLSEIHPDEVYRFFMSNFMDAYDWVMVPNVYGMSQYADGGLMTTKPYFSGSNYLKKQGFKIDADGAALFDALFWNFVDKHQESLRKNMRTAQMVANWNRMLPPKKTAHLERAALYFQKGMDSL